MLRNRPAQEENPAPTEGIGANLVRGSVTLKTGIWKRPGRFHQFFFSDRKWKLHMGPQAQELDFEAGFMFCTQQEHGRHQKVFVYTVSGRKRGIL